MREGIRERINIKTGRRVEVFLSLTRARTHTEKECDCSGEGNFETKTLFFAKKKYK